MADLEEVRAKAEEIFRTTEHYGVCCGDLDGALDYLMSELRDARQAAVAEAQLADSFRAERDIALGDVASRIREL